MVRRAMRSIVQDLKNRNKLKNKINMENSFAVKDI